MHVCDQKPYVHKMIQRAADHNSDNPSTDPRKAADKITKGMPPPSETWSRLKDPRVVRVSRALGGKDRHSKVFTVRGLRDRRVRLSVHTAIQLYDLQERLGLTQPSKAVDWLLNAAKHEIDELPPLQIPPSAMSITGPTNLHQISNFQEFRPNKRDLKVGGENEKSNKGSTNNWASGNDIQDGTSQVHDLENKTTNNTYSSIFRIGHLTSQHEDNWHNFGLSPFSTSMPLGFSHDHNQVVVYRQPGIMNTNIGDFSGLPTIGSTSQPISARSFNFNSTTANLLPLHDETDGSR